MSDSKQYSSKDLTAYCGYYCGDCYRFQNKIMTLAGQLAHEIENSEFDKYVRMKHKITAGNIHDISSYDHFKTFLSVIEKITRQECKSPCRAGSDGCEGACPVKICVKGREIEGCWECDEAESCVKADFLKPIWGKALSQNIKQIKKHGIDSWVPFRGKPYAWL